MTSKKTSKINQVFKNWPRGTVATQKWLTKLGVSSKLANWHVGSGWLVRLGSEAFAQPGDKVEWQGGLYALQIQLGMTVPAGARTALELIGYAHNIPLGQRKTVFLVSDKMEQLPVWFRSYQWEANLRHNCFSLFGNIPARSVTKLDCGGFSIAMSGAERAIMEVMRLANSNYDMVHTYQLMEKLTTLRPELVQELLENCRSNKVKRLFLWSAETADHVWFSRLDTARIDLGKGKRHLYKGGTYNKKYRITVPPQEGLPDV